MSDAWPPFIPAYRTILAGLGVEALDPGCPQTSVDTRFLEFLITEFARQMPFDAAFYRSAYAPGSPASAAASAAALQAAFAAEGFRAGRLPHAPAFHADAYLHRNPDLAGLFADTGADGLRQHFLQHGWQEGRTAHPAAEADAARWWEAVQRTPYRLAHRTIGAAAIQAFQPPAIAGPPLGFRGGLVLTDAPSDRRLRHRRGGEVVDSFPRPVTSRVQLRGAYVYGGAVSDHFGHAMAETIHRVLPARAVFACSRLLFVAERAPRRGVEGFAALPPVMQAALLFLRVEPAYVSVTHADCAVETLHVAEQGSTLLGGPVPAYLEMLAAHGAAHLAVGPREGRLYVSRSRLPFGTILGERYLELGLAADGWRVIHPETMPLTEQLSAYANAAVILFAEGSAVHGTELLAAVGDCLLLPRRNTEAWWIEAALRPRARSLDALPRGTPLGSALADQQSGAALEHMGVTLMDFPAVAEDLRRRGLARLQELSVDGYRAAARTDWETYVQSCGNSAVRPPGVRLAAPPEIAALRLLARSQIG